MNRWRVMLVFCFVVFTLWMVPFIVPQMDAALGAAANQTLNTTVNITNSAPFVHTVTLPTSIDLEAYGNVTVQCNVSLNDYDNNTQTVNATLYHSTSTSDAGDAKIDHYSNTTCVRVGPKDIAENYTCTFSVAFFANNGTWECNATAIDTPGAAGSNVSNTGVINPLIAIYVPGVLDFGNLEFGEISTNKLANITNAGNRRVNISLEGWGVAKGDGLAMDCTYGNIDNSYERYNISQVSDFPSALQLPTTEIEWVGMNVTKRTSETLDSTVQTNWRLEIPAGAGGICNGKILFTASEYGN